MDDQAQQDARETKSTRSSTAVERRRKPYRAPVLSNLGNIAQITAGNGNDFNDTAFTLQNAGGPSLP